MEKFIDVTWGLALGMVGLAFTGLVVLAFGVVVAAVVEAVGDRFEERRKE